MSEAQYRIFPILDLILRLHPRMISLHRIIKRGFMVRTFQRVKRFFTYNLPSWYQRPRAYWKNFYQWHLSQVPEEIEFQNKKIKNPARWKAVFVVHGMGHSSVVTTQIYATVNEDNLRQAAERIQLVEFTPKSLPQ